MTSIRRCSLKLGFIDYYRDYCIIKYVDRFMIYAANKCYYDHQNDEIIVIDAPYRSITGDNLMERHRQARKWIDRLIKGGDSDR